MAKVPAERLWLFQWDSGRDRAETWWGGCLRGKYPKMLEPGPLEALRGRVRR